MRLVVVAILALLSGGLQGRDALAGDDDGPPACRCAEGQACWHWLRAPVPPPDDPCSCARCERVGRHGGSDPWPGDWRRTTFRKKGEALTSFLRRHAASWGFVCSVCDRALLPGIEAPGEYPFKPASGQTWNPRALEMIRKQLGIERELLGYEPVVIESPHFYLVTDISSLKIAIQGRSKHVKRVIETHELAHVYLERLEMGYREFRKAVGTPRLRRPIGVYMPESSTVAHLVQERYLGHMDTTILLGGGGSEISGGHCAGAFTVALNRQKLPSPQGSNNPDAQKVRVAMRSGIMGGSRKYADHPSKWPRLLDDDQVHTRLRHLLGHALMAAWPSVRVRPDRLPPWVYVGVGHWLSKRHRRLVDLATFCGEECAPVKASGKDWAEKALALAVDRRRAPLQEVFAANTIPEFNRFDLHLRAWSLFEEFLEHDRERFGRFLLAIRDGTGAAAACQKAMDGSIDEIDRRWEDLVRRRRPSAGETEEPDSPEAGPAERKAIAAVRGAKEPLRRAALLKNLSPKALRTGIADLVPLLGDPSAHVRETTVLRLASEKDEEVGAFLRDHGLVTSGWLELANVIRVLDLRGDRAATDAILGLLGHVHWLVRANAARALASLGEGRAEEALLKAFRREASPKAAIAAMDALAALAEDTDGVAAAIAPQLDSVDWPVQTAAAEALGRLGSMGVVDDLIATMTRCGGRVREACYEALKRISRDDLGRKPDHWRDWWAKEKTRAGGLPERPAGPVAGADPLGERATGTADPEDPTYYGLRVHSSRVGFVLDVSHSMTTVFRPTESLQQRLRRAAGARPRIEFARDELIDAVGALDPRTAFAIWTFHDVVEVWKKWPVVANGTNKSRATAYLRGVQTGKTTNYYDTFRSIFALPERGLPSERFRSTPDTLYFLTDGEPTVGDITDREELLSWFREENRFARLRVHVIAFGDKNLDFELLETLARETGGTLLHLRER